MMDGIVRVRNSLYDRYEELLLRRDALRKEAFQLEREYVRTFGDLILEVFQLKLECIRRKKTIEFCQAAANRGKSVEQSKLQDFLKQELAALQTQLDEMVKDADAAKKTGTVTEVELLQIKKIYHKMVKKIHPDVNPVVAKTEALQELWNRMVVAYNCNNLKEMQETEVLITKALEQLGNETTDIEIPNIEEKITELEEEIIKIRETDPYQFKYILDDPDAVADKKNSLNEEKKSYEEYGNQLDKILQGLVESGVSFTWRMN